MKVSAIIGALSLGLLALGSSASWAAGPAAVDIHQDPTAVGSPVGSREPMTVKFHLEAKEVLGKLSEKETFNYWTFNGKVPGPMLRARVGDTIEVTLSNAKDSLMTHSVDLHAVWGQGGGAELTSVAPGESKTFTFKALHAGLFVYHCATPVIPQHISSGMYGMILIEPKGGLPKVDKEFYIMQGDMYVEGKGTQKDFSQDLLLAEHPTHVVMNGSAAALAANPMKVKVGDNVRVFFGVGGPNLTSSMHAIGTVFDKVYNSSTTSSPATDVQTTLVAAAGSAMIEFKARVPAKYIFVDHSLSRLMKGNVAIMIAEGAEQPDLFRAGAADAKPLAKPAKK